MAVTKAKKSEILSELDEMFGKAKSIVFAANKGLSVKDASHLRGQLRKGKNEMKVAKKTLIRIAAEKHNIKDIDDAVMTGAVAAIFCYEDPLSGIKALFKFSKENEKLELLGGIMDGKVISADIVKRYAAIPSREELLAKMMGSMKSPVSGFVGVLSGTLGGFVRVLQAFNESRPAEEPKAEEPPKEEPKKEEPKEESSAPPAEEKPAEPAAGVPEEGPGEGKTE
ncbi:50S ribosomal protein L10 [Candidatus Peregrinibacteria bacterium]|nr:50S ribosomal protein L10 [Candidatus Peregrinibacteria bacterium]